MRDQLEAAAVGSLCWISTPGGAPYDLNTQGNPIVATIEGQRLIIQPSSDGKIHQINLTTGVDEKQFPAATTLDGTQVGDVSTETGAELFVGTLAGKLYKIPLPLP